MNEILLSFLRIIYALQAYLSIGSAMRKLIFGIIITIIFGVISMKVFKALYTFNIISGIPDGPYKGFILLKFYSAFLQLFYLYKSGIHRNVKFKQKEWMLLSIYALHSTASCFIILNL